MSEKIKEQLSWGLKHEVPDHAPVAWGARACWATGSTWQGRSHCARPLGAP
jgi:hypothetical protein